MSDGERGPYTPQGQREAPLQFDARGPRDAKPMPMALIASAAVLVVLVGAVAMAYLGGGSKTDAAGKPVGDRVLVMKTPPAPGANPAPDPNAKLEVFSDHPAAAPTFAAAPEAPAPRPPARLTLQAQALPPVRIASAESTTTITATTTTRPAPAQVAPAAATNLSTARPMTPKPNTTAAAPATAGSVGVQIGAFSSRALAEKGYADVGKLVSTSGRGKRIEAVERGDSTLYRTTVTGFADRDAAKAFCAGLSAKGHACIVKS
ncbi:cell division protein FtsN [soil metagenome]